MATCRSRPTSARRRCSAWKANRARDRQAQLFIETPYRNEAMLGSIAAALQPATHVCIAADLTLPSETIARHSAREWKTRDHAQFCEAPGAVRAAGLTADAEPAVARTADQGLASSGQSLMYDFSIRFSKFCSSYTALATSWKDTTPCSIRPSITGT